ncbi:DUF6573 family protein [Amycolatopsis japonica]|uniref:DUF6573 family protein n=1 Tax=Amycolatopsis japonica TaxID=208439 RepID=UPI00366C65D5
MSKDDNVQPQQTFGFYDWEIIYSYTRADALRDGELVAAGPALLEQAGFRWPLAYTHSAFEGCINWTGTDSHTARTHEIRQARELVLLTAPNRAIRMHTNPDDNTLPFSVRVTPRTGHALEQQQVTLYAVFGPGDEGELVITVLFDLTEL